MNSITDTILIADKVNGNNRLYSEEVVKFAIERAQKRIDEGKFYCYHRNRIDYGDLHPTEAVGICTGLKLECGRMEATIQVLDSHCAQLMSGYALGAIKFRPNGVGEVETDPETGVYVVSNYTLTSISVVSTDEAAPLDNAHDILTQ